MGKKLPVVLGLSVTSGGVANTDLLSFPVDPGQLLCVQRVSFEDATTLCTGVRLGLKRGTGFVWIDGTAAIVAGILYSFVDAFWVPSGYQVVVRFEGSTAGDQLTTLLLGYLTDVPTD